MIRIGLTGGIGAGKSTVSAAFNDCGGIIVDGDVIAREVVEPGTEGLASLVDAFGDDILREDGALNRPALAAKAFVDDEKRQLLNGIVHPLVARRREEIIAAVSADAVVVEDIPLLVETGLAPMFPLVVVVHADEQTRVERLIKRGMDEADARARIAAQASEEQRRAIADVLLDNSGSQGELGGTRAGHLVSAGAAAGAQHPHPRVGARPAGDGAVPTGLGRRCPPHRQPARRWRAGTRPCGWITSGRRRSRAWTPRMSSTSR